MVTKLGEPVDGSLQRGNACLVTPTQGRELLPKFLDHTLARPRFAVRGRGRGVRQQRSEQRLTSGLDVRPRKGHLVITDRHPGFVRHQLVELGYLKSAHGTTADSVAFNVQPRKTGQILIGSSRQYGNDDPAIDHAILGRMIDRAIEYMPDIARLSAIRAWTGFRPSTPDKLPLIGAMPADPRLFVATGHEGLGITTSLGTARLLTEQLLGRPTSIAADPYLPARYAKTAQSAEVAVHA